MNVAVALLFLDQETQEPLYQLHFLRFFCGATYYY